MRRIATSKAHTFPQRPAPRQVASRTQALIDPLLRRKGLARQRRLKAKLPVD